MSPFMTFIGHWHPVVVHLPIGMILAALLLQLLASRPAYSALRPAVPVMLLAGAFSGVISCCTGWILSTSGDYDATLVGWHQWMAIGLTFFCFYVWSRSRQKGFDRTQTLLSIALLLLVIITGHLGGSLTHGSDYLSLNPSIGSLSEVDSPILDVQKARAYAEIVRPILRDNCYSCHGAIRQKGGLRLNDTIAMMKGGKDGIVIRPGQGSASELIKRLLLPLEDEHHMPPKEKKQLNERQIALLHWWIDQGADRQKLVAQLRQPDSVRPALLSVQGAKPRILESDLPAENVAAADEQALEALRAKGVLVMPVARGSHWLEADFSAANFAANAAVPVPTGSAPANSSAAPANSSAAPAAPANSSATSAPAASGSAPAPANSATPAGSTASPANPFHPEMLLPLKKQLLSLKLAHTAAGDSAMTTVAQCTALRSLDLAATRITDAGLAQLKSLPELKVLNLVGTPITAAGAQTLKSLPKLRTLYLYKTKISTADWAALRKALPKVDIDTGGYSLPVLDSDTAIVRQAKPSTN
jgi:uncharacterized membrane protein/mono/diheme cytochrome c family protein